MIKVTSLVYVKKEIEMGMDDPSYSDCYIDPNKIMSFFESRSDLHKVDVVIVVLDGGYEMEIASTFEDFENLLKNNQCQLLNAPTVNIA